MAKQLLGCDICGGSIAVQAGGKLGICANCGANYTLERMREIYSGMKVSVTGTAEDVAQWKSLLETYMRAYDYEAADRTTKKILEAMPDDEYANIMYHKLQDLKYLDIKNGVLIKYNGHSSCVDIPANVVAIEAKAFADCRNLKSVTLPVGIKEIMYDTFNYCISLEKVVIPEGVEVIGKRAFNDCEKLASITLPNTLRRICSDAFKGCVSLANIVIPDSVECIERNAFWGCERLSSITVPIRFRGTLDEYFPYTAYVIKRNQEHKEDEQYRRRLANRCQYCGSEFRGLFTKTCIKCGRQKDY